MVNLALVEVVYLWAQQKEFSEICDYTWVQEGSIVRIVRRLEQLIGNLKNACNVIGNNSLQEKLEEAQTLVKRDIIF